MRDLLTSKFCTHVRSCCFQIQAQFFSSFVIQFKFLCYTVAPQFNYSQLDTLQAAPLHIFVEVFVNMLFTALQVHRPVKQYGKHEKQDACWWWDCVFSTGMDTEHCD